MFETLASVGMVALAAWRPGRWTWWYLTVGYVLLGIEATVRVLWR